VLGSMVWDRSPRMTNPPPNLEFLPIYSANRTLFTIPGRVLSQTEHRRIRMVLTVMERQMPKDQEVSQALIEEIADRLSRPIPQPAKPVARTQQSWRTLKVGQQLSLRQRWFRSGGLDLPPGTNLTISKVDSLGISLTHNSEESILRWTNPDWKPMFEKVKKGKAK